MLFLDFGEHYNSQNWFVSFDFAIPKLVPLQKNLLMKVCLQSVCPVRYTRSAYSVSYSASYFLALQTTTM